MKFIKLTLIALLPCLMIGCAASQNPEDLMGAVSYEKPITIHSEKNAYLAWRSGSEMTSQSYTHTNSYGINGLAEGIAINIDKSNNPGKYTYRFGKAQKVVFMTSLRDVLTLDKTFKNVNIITSPQALKENDVLITINFKHTTVNQGEIKLDVEIDIQDSTGHLTKTHFLKSDHELDQFYTAYTEKQEDVSKQLMAKVVRDIERWHEQAIN